MTKWFFAPSGRPITSLSARSFSSPEIKIDEEGEAGLGSFDDFPHFEAINAPGYGEMGFDSDSDEWLLSHCRLIEVDDDEFDAWDDELVARLGWDDRIIAACTRMRYLVQNLWLTKELRSWLPTDVAEDPTIDAVITTIIEGRLRGEADQLQAEIDAYRATRVEPTSLIEEGEDVDA